MGKENTSPVFQLIQDYFKYHPITKIGYAIYDLAGYYTLCRSEWVEGRGDAWFERCDEYEHFLLDTHRFLDHLHQFILDGGWDDLLKKYEGLRIVQEIREANITNYVHDCVGDIEEVFMQYFEKPQRDWPDQATLDMLCAGEILHRFSLLLTSLYSLVASVQPYKVAQEAMLEYKRRAS